MSEKLDNYVPSREALSGIRRQLEEAGIPLESIPEDWLVAIAAAMNKWLFSGKDGLEFAASRMQLKWKRGDDDKEYEYYHTQSGEVYPVPPEKTLFYWGASVFGRPVDPEMVMTMDKSCETCEGCGVSMYCVSEYSHPVKGRLETLCRSCAAQSDYRADLSDTCTNCTMTSCAHNPRHVKRA